MKLQTNFGRCVMKSFVSARSFALLCVLFSAMGGATSARALPPAGAGVLPGPGHSAAMRATATSMSHFTGSLSSSISLHPGARDLHPELQTAGPQSGRGAVLQRAARPAEFHANGLQQVSDMEEPSWLFVLGTCLLGFAAALFRKMKV